MGRARALLPIAAVLVVIAVLAAHEATALSRNYTNCQIVDAASDFRLYWYDLF